MNRRRNTLSTAAAAAAALALAAVGGPAVSAPAGPAAAPGLGAGEKLVRRAVVTDPDGTTHTRYDRTFAGLRVVGGDLVVERSAGGSLRGTHRAAAAVAVASTSPSVTASRAVAAASARTTGRLTDRPSSELVVLATGASPRLAYDVVTTGVKADQTPTRVHTFVDARTGAVLDGWDEIHTGTGSSQYSGQVAIETSPGYVLKDAMGNHSTDLKGATTGTGVTFTDADDVWGNGSTTDRATAGVDAHYGAEQTAGYFRAEQGRNGIWGDGRGARSRVHYGNAYVNAFWDGTQMTYGDGAGNAKPLTALDIAAHEMSHGVTENTANLAYRGDAGGLNEATSDIFAAAVEWYANSPADPADYLVGEKIDINGNGTPLRYMDKPSKDGRSVDCWSTQVSRLDPHYSSGPLNHWYYLLSEGSGAKTVNGVAYSSSTCGGAPAVPGIGHLKAEKIWYRTLSTKLTSTSTYKSAREGAITSARELYGAGSAECVATQKAFDAITVPAGAARC